MSKTKVLTEGYIKCLYKIDAIWANIHIIFLNFMVDK